MKQIFHTLLPTAPYPTPKQQLNPFITPGCMGEQRYSATSPGCTGRRVLLLVYATDMGEQRSCAASRFFKNIKKSFSGNFFLLIVSLFLILNSCSITDPLYRIRLLAYSKDLSKNEEGAKYYKEAIDTLVRAYQSYALLNKDIGKKLMLQKNYRPAIEHLEAAKAIRNDDEYIYYWLAICYGKMYTIEANQVDLTAADQNYKIAVRISPDDKDILYGYASLLVFQLADYSKAIQMLNRYIYGNPESKKSIIPVKYPKPYILLGRAYYLNGNLDEALKTFNEADQYRKFLNKDDQNSLDELILQVRSSF